MPKKWFVAVGVRWTGPLTSAEVVEGVRTGKWSWLDFAWCREIGAAWVRLAGIKDFQASIMPPRPSLDLLESIKQRQEAVVAAAAPPTPESQLLHEQSLRRAVWYVEFNKSKFGPFAFNELKDFWEQGKLKGGDIPYAWREGTPDWLPLDDVMTQAGVLTDGKKRVGIERRVLPRVPLVATVAFKWNNRFSVGSSREISELGMRITAQVVPNPVGTRISLNVEPNRWMGVEDFSVDGTVIEHVQQPLGFCVRFERPQLTIRAAISKCLEVPG